MPPPLTLVRALAAGRILFGIGLLATPRVAASFWVGPRRARRPEAAVLGRGLGGRDLALGAATLGALRHEDPRVLRGALAACAVSDGADLLATIVARRHLPAAAATLTIAAAGGSTAIALAALLGTPAEQAG